MRDYEDMSRSELVTILELKDVELDEMQSRLDDNQLELEKLQDMTWPEPTPFFVRTGDINRQLLHIIEECGEASKELRKLNSIRAMSLSCELEANQVCFVAMEVTDIIFSCFTALAILGYDDVDRSELFYQTIQKNKRRNYYV